MEETLVSDRHSTRPQHQSNNQHSSPAQPSPPLPNPIKRIIPSRPTPKQEATDNRSINHKPLNRIIRRRITDRRDCLRRWLDYRRGRLSQILGRRCRLVRMERRWGDRRRMDRMVNRLRRSSDGVRGFTIPRRTGSARIPLVIPLSPPNSIADLEVGFRRIQSRLRCNYRRSATSPHGDVTDKRLYSRTSRSRCSSERFEIGFRWASPPLLQALAD